MALRRPTAAAAAEQRARRSLPLCLGQCLIG
eukprot:CAMPEP_0198662636 /NCGR_PEP_ID=MMETSP1467-20131203/48417_1 /TAXON_ID=1462469 /ORGANISM="unid. sp., Strain CCMP2135" /LENGTH=30 /DNA_ID= /DNA_START= /DNA_END= /DNA_ORIENTATION=